MTQAERIVDRLAQINNRGVKVRVVEEELAKAPLDVARLAKAIREDDDRALGDVSAYLSEAKRLAAEYAK